MRGIGKDTRGQRAGSGESTDHQDRPARSANAAVEAASGERERPSWDPWVSDEVQLRSRRLTRNFVESGNLDGGAAGPTVLATVVSAAARTSAVDDASESY